MLCSITVIDTENRIGKLSLILDAAVYIHFTLMPLGKSMTTFFLLYSITRYFDKITGLWHGIIVDVMGKHIIFIANLLKKVAAKTIYLAQTIYNF